MIRQEYDNCTKIKKDNHTLHILHPQKLPFKSSTVWLQNTESDNHLICLQLFTTRPTLRSVRTLKECVTSLTTRGRDHRRTLRRGPCSTLDSLKGPERQTTRGAHREGLLGKSIGQTVDKTRGRVQGVFWILARRWVALTRRFIGITST